jgi:hypothetical protein
MRAAYFDDDGFLLCVASGDAVLGPAPGTAAFPIAGDVDPNALFLAEGELAERTAVDPLIARTRVIAGGEDGVRISGLPDPCWVLVNGARRHVEGGEIEISADAPGWLPIEIVGAHRSAVICIRADTAAAFLDEVRIERNERLAATDWTAVADAPLTDAQRAAWAEYRTVLRDLTGEQPHATLDTVTWPAQPVVLP